MKKQIVTLTFARLLQSLIDRELNYADFNSAANRRLLEQFIDDNVLEYRMIGRQQKKIYCPDPDNLRKYLHNKFEIPSLERYISFFERDDFQRSDAVVASSDSKIRKRRVFAGFLVNSYSIIQCHIDERPFTLHPASGVVPFIADYESFVVPKDVIVVVVENYENFMEIGRQSHLFSEINPLFVWRYQNSNAIAEWLNLIENRYIHFGDFDLKGIHIYLSEFKAKITGNRSSFFIPSHIESLLINYGSKSLYEDQKSILPAIQRHELNEISVLLDLIIKHRKGLSQEVLIRSLETNGGGLFTR